MERSYTLDSLTNNALRFENIYLKNLAKEGNISEIPDKPKSIFAKRIYRTLFEMIILGYPNILNIFIFCQEWKKIKRNISA